MTTQPKTPAEIYLVPDAEHGNVWHTDATPGEGMCEEDATRYVREDLVPASNEVLARRVVELTAERDTATADYAELQLQHDELQTMLFNEREKAARIKLTLLRGRIMHDENGHEIWCLDPAEVDKAVEAVPAQHSDDLAVDRFASAMKAKLAAARAKGRSGWDDKENCSGKHLAQLLVEHLSKANAGTFEDIANFAMMLHQRGEDPKLLFIALATHVATMYVHQSNTDTHETKAQAVRDFIQWGIQKVDPEFAEFKDCAEHYISTELSQQAKAGD